jgi:hypothetical protein
MNPDLSAIFAVLDGYIQEFEPTIAREHLPNVVSAILQLQGYSSDTEAMATIVDRVVSLFDPQLAQTNTVTSGVKPMAGAVSRILTKQRSRQLAELVGQTLQQRFHHIVSAADLPDIVQQLLPDITPLHLNQVDIPRLVSKVASHLNPALTSKATNLTEAIATGKQLVTAVLENFGSQQFIVDVLKSCARTMVGGMIADSDLPDVIKTIIAATEIKFNQDDGNFFIEEVAFTYRSGTSGAFILPDAQQLAQRIDGEVRTFLAQRAYVLRPTDVTTPIVYEASAGAGSTDGENLVENLGGLTGLRPVELRSNLEMVGTSDAAASDAAAQP